MNTCDNCKGYNDTRTGICSHCQRMLDEQDGAWMIAEKNQELQRQALVQELTKKLLDISMESLENEESAFNKLKILMGSAIFKQNEESLWREIEVNRFLADSYYQFRLGVPPQFDAIRGLPSHAVKALGSYIRGARQTEDIKELNKLHEQFLIEEQTKRDRERYANRLHEKDRNKEAAKKNNAELQRWARESAEQSEERSKSTVGIRTMVVFLTTAHAFGILCAIPVKNFLGWDFLSDLNWLAWLPIVAAYLVLFVKFCVVAFRGNNPDGEPTHMYETYSNESLFGFSKNFQGENTETIILKNPLSEADFGIFAYLWEPRAYELCFSVALLITTIKNTAPGTSRLLGAIGFIGFLLLMPFRRFVHYSAIGLLLGTILMFCSQVLATILSCLNDMLFG